jgi:hypothetical protein
MAVACWAAAGRDTVGARQAATGVTVAGPFHAPGAAANSTALPGDGLNGVCLHRIGRGHGVNPAQGPAVDRPTCDARHADGSFTYGALVHMVDGSAYSRPLAARLTQ